LKGVASAGGHVAEVIRALGSTFALLGLHLLFDVRISVVRETQQPPLTLREVADDRRPTEAIALLVEVRSRPCLAR